MDDAIPELSILSENGDTHFCFFHPLLVVLASFLCHVVVYGICWTVGVWNVVFLNEFGQSAAQTSVVGALVNAFLFLSSFACGFMLKPLGCRTLTLTGNIRW